MTVIPLSRMPLTVTFERKKDSFTNLTLTGEARAVYEGLMRPEAWEYSLR